MLNFQKPEPRDYQQNQILAQHWYTNMLVAIHVNMTLRKNGFISLSLFHIDTNA
jgi:hypothetical protein